MHNVKCEMQGLQRDNWPPCISKANAYKRIKVFACIIQ